MTKRILGVLLAFCMAGALTACGSAVSGGQPGNGKWRNSDIYGSVTETEAIRLQDDFAAAANQAFISAASPGDDTFTKTMLTVLSKKQDLLVSLPDEGEAGELKKFAALASNWEERNRQGVEPLRKYIKAIESISSLEDLTAFQCDREQNPLGLGLLMPTVTNQSPTDPRVCVLSIDTPSLSLGSSGEYFSLSNAGLEAREGVIRLTEHILGQLGYEAGEIRDILQGCFRFEKKLAQGMRELSKPQMKRMQVRRDACIQSAGGYPLEEILNAWNVPEDGVCLLDTISAANILPLYREGNLRDFKSMLIVLTLRNAALYLDRETADLVEELNTSRLREPSETITFSDEIQEQALLFNYIGSSAFGPILDRYYVETYASGESIRSAEEMTQEILEAFRGLFERVSWLSEEGKAKCLEKLDAMEVHVAVPNFDLQDWSGLTILSREEGGSFLDAFFTAESCKKEQSFQLCSQPFDRSVWNPAAVDVSTTQVNAMYVPSLNAIYIFAGILTEPAYSPAMSLEQRLAGVGTIIGHEITHAFDDSGARYDKDGLENSWLPLTDQLTFSDRCDKVAEYYQTIRPIPGGGAYAGQRVTGEAVADMGGLRVTLDIASGIEGFDYDAYFRQYAAQWNAADPLDIERSAFETDVHPLPYLRINVGLQQFDPFYDTYGVKDGDGMYLARDKRIAVW